MSQTTKPKYFPWNEEEFFADSCVRLMTPKQRWMYRTLLQQSFFVTSRPRLPVDDSELWTLAGCETKKEWARNKAKVLAKFTVVEIDGVKYLENKRVIRDWDVLLEARERMVEMGKRSAEVRRTFNHGSTAVQPTLNLGATARSTREVKVSKEKVSEVNEGGQDEPLTGEEMAFNQNIANIAAEILKFTKGLTTHEKGELKLLARAYGTDRVETDFEAWARENRGGNIQYPISLYLKKASARLESEPEPEIADDPRIRQVTAKVYEMTGRLPINADLTNITKWLTKYSVEDIITGFSEYLHGLDGFEQKWAVKNYFSGGGEVVLEAIALRRASEKKWVVSEEESDFTAIRRDEGPVNDEI